MTEARAAWGWGLATIHASGPLDTYFPAPRLGADEIADARRTSLRPKESTTCAGSGPSWSAR